MAKKPTDLEKKYAMQKKFLYHKAETLGIVPSKYQHLSDLKDAVDIKEKEYDKIFSENMQKIIDIKEEKERQQKLKRITFVDHSDISSDETYREIIVSNSLHTMRWIIPTRLDGANAWHVPQLIFDTMKQEKFLQKPEDPTGNAFEAQKLMDPHKVLNNYTKNRYSITELPPLNQHELETLKLKARVGT